MTHVQLGAVLQHITRIAGGQANRQATDGDLLERFSGRKDQAAFGELMRRHGPMVLSVCRRVLGHAQDAEDTFQATFLLLARKAASIRKRGSVGSWLYGVAYHLASKARAQRARRQAHERRGGKMKTGAAVKAAWQEVQVALDEALSELPEKYRAALILCYLQGNTHEEAARHLGCPLATLRSRVARGRALLRAGLARRGLGLSMGGFATLFVTRADAAAPPVALVHATFRAAVRFAAGEPAARLVSSAVAHLIEGGLKTMVMTKVKIGMAFLVALGLLAAGAGIGAHQALTAPAPQEQSHDGRKPVAEKDGPPKPEGEQPARADRFGDALPPGALMRLGTVRFRSGGQFLHGVAFTPDGKSLALASGSVLGLWDATTGKEVRRIAERQASYGGVAFSLDGKLLAATCPSQNVVRLYDVASGKELRVLKGHTRMPMQVTFSPDSKTLASAGGGPTGEARSIRLWDVATGKELQRLTGHKDVISDLAFSPDGKSLASAGIEETVRLWDVVTGKELHRLRGTVREGYLGVVNAVAFSPPDGKLVACGHGDGTVHLWDPQTGKEVRQFKAHPEVVSALVFSPDGKTLMSGGLDRTVRLWEVASGKELRRFSGGAEPLPGGLALSRDGKALATWGAYTNAVRLWDPDTGLERSPFGGHRAGVFTLAVSADGKTLTSSGRDGTVRSWDLGTGKEQRCAPAVPDWAETWALSGDSTLLAFTSIQSGGIRIKDATSGKDLGHLVGHQKPKVQWDYNWVSALAFSPDNCLLVSAGSDRTVRFWDLATGKELRRLEGLDPVVRSLAFSPDGKVVACGVTGVAGSVPKDGLAELEPGEGTVRLLDAATAKEVRRITAHGEDAGGQRNPSVLLFSPDSKLLVTARTDDAAICIWEVATGKRVVRIRQPGDPSAGTLGLFTLAFSLDGRILAGSWPGGVIYLWDSRTGKEIRKFRGHRNDVRCLAFSPDGRLLFSGSDDGTILGWDVTGRAQAEAPRRAAPVSLLAGRVAALQEERRERERQFRETLRAAGDDRAKVSEVNRDYQVFLSGIKYELKELVGDDRQDPAALEGIVFLVRELSCPLDKGLARLVLDHHLAHAKVGQLCFALTLVPVLDGAEGLVETLLRETAAKHPQKVARGLAAYALGDYYRRRAKPTGRRLGEAEEVKRSAEAERCYTEVTKTYAAVLTPDGRARLGDLAARELTRLKNAPNLKVGKTAPEIIGTDLDGRRLKLSDYRSKVVVLSFYGFW